METKQPQFKIGDIVSHVTNNNHKMVIIGFEENIVRCRWMDHSGKLLIEKFLPQELNFYNPPYLGVTFSK